MGDIEVVTAELRAAAGKVGAAADSVDGVQPGPVVERVSGALPGSESGSSASRCSTTWTQGLKNWVTAAGSQKNRLETSAANYDGADAAAYARMAHMLRSQ